MRAPASLAHGPQIILCSHGGLLVDQKDLDIFLIAPPEIMRSDVGLGIVDDGGCEYVGVFERAAEKWAGHIALIQRPTDPREHRGFGYRDGAVAT